MGKSIHWIGTLSPPPPGRAEYWPERQGVTHREHSNRESTRGTDWLVMLDSYPVTFRTEFEAIAFVDKLKARIDAPHESPARLPEWAFRLNSQLAELAKQ